MHTFVFPPLHPDFFVNSFSGSWRTFMLWMYFMCSRPSLFVSPYFNLMNFVWVAAVVLTSYCWKALPDSLRLQLEWLLLVVSFLTFTPLKYTTFRLWNYPLTSGMLTLAHILTRNAGDIRWWWNGGKRQVLTDSGVEAVGQSWMHLDTHRLATRTEGRGTGVWNHLCS